MKAQMLVIGLLFLGVTANITLAVAAMHDPGLAVEEHYYERAIHWDDYQAQVARNRALGWNVEVTNAHPLALRITGREGVRLVGATVTLQGYRIASGDKPIAMTLRPGVDGEYTSDKDLRHHGLWRLIVTVQHDQNTFTQVVKTDVL